MKPRPLFAAGLALVLAGFVPTACRAQGEGGDPTEVLKLIQPDLQTGKVDAAIEKVEKFVKDKPKHTGALFILTALTQQVAQQVSQADRTKSIPIYMKSAEAAQKLIALKAKLNPPQEKMIATALYNGACSLALDKKPDEAMKMLNEAVDAGFDEQDVFDKDDEINSLRERPDFKKVAEAIKNKKAEGAAKAAEAEAKNAEKAVAEVPNLFKENKPFPFSFSLPNLDDKKVSLDDYKGKVVIVDIWGTWCPPCKKEIPHFVDLHKQYKDKGLEIVGINYEDGAPDEVKKVIKDFIAENKIPYTCVIGDEKTQNQVPDFEGYPTTLFLDRTGKVRLKVVGYHEKPVLDAIVKTLLDEK